MADPISSVVGAVSDRNQAKSSKRASNAAANVQKESINDALGKQTEIYDENKGFFDPTYKSGLKASDQFNFNMGIGNDADYTNVNRNIGSFGSSNRAFELNDFEKDPSFNRSNASKRGYFSGAAEKGLAKYNQDYASTRFKEAEDRYNRNRDDIYTKFKSQKDEGYNAGVNMANLGTQYANTYGDLVTDRGGVEANRIGQNNYYNGLQRAANSQLISQGANAVISAATGGMNGGGFVGAARGFYNGAGIPFADQQQGNTNKDLFKQNYGV